MLSKVMTCHICNTRRPEKRKRIDIWSHISTYTKTLHRKRDKLMQRKLCLYSLMVFFQILRLFCVLQKVFNRAMER